MTRIRYWLSQRLWWLAFWVAPSIASVYDFDGAMWSRHEDKEFTASDIDAEYDFAYDTGFRHGFEAGSADGWEKGWEEGFEEGHELNTTFHNDVPAITPSNEELREEALASAGIYDDDEFAHWA